MTIANERPEQIAQSTGMIYKAYANAVVVIIADQPRPDLKIGHARFVQSTPMKNQACGGQWWNRLFQEALKEQGELVFKIDPDTHVNRQLNFIPAADCFGTLLPNPGEHIQGGCQGFWRTSAQQIVDNGLLLDPAYQDWRTWAFERNDFDFGQGAWAGYLSTDRINMHVLNRLKMTWANHPEMACYYCLNERPLDFEAYAINHPHK